MDENLKERWFTNRDGDQIHLINIEPNHWRMYKNENFYGVSVHGEAPKYVAADFIGGGPMVSAGSNMDEFINGVNEKVEYIAFSGELNSFDIYTKTNSNK